MDMRKIIVFSMISLDGVMQAPGGPKEDTSGDFQYGGWTAPLGDDLYGQVVKKELEPAEYLLGRKTFEIWEAYWPSHGDFWPGINSGMKYVLSNSRIESHWQNTRFLKNSDDIQQLKNTNGSDLHVWGSGELVKLLLKHNLVDELRLKIHPLLLGNGKKLFDNQAFPTTFELIDQVTTSKGVIIATYRKAGKVKTGQSGE